MSFVDVGLSVTGALSDGSLAQKAELVSLGRSNLSSQEETTYKKYKVYDEQSN